MIKDPRPARGWFLGLAAILWLATCRLPTVIGGSSPPEMVLTPIATLVPIPSATARETVVGPAGTLAIAPPESEELALYDLLELDLQTDIPTSNPFDPDELEIRVKFTSPSGKEVDVGAFWYQAFDPKGWKRVGEPGWKARFTPTEMGAWTAVARIPSRGLESAAVHLRVTRSANHGFVRVHPANPRYFAFDDGSFFFPIGLNMGWWSGAGDALTDYKKWLTPFAANGGNTIRVWMASWSFGLEWDDTPLGDYENRLRQAWLLDQAFRMADERDVYVILVLLNACDFSEWTGCQWRSNPYKATQGGPLGTPGEFATDPVARAYFQRRLNYIVNRWGYSPNLLAWEWWNEVNLSAIPDEALVPWLQEMTSYLRSRDVNRHMTTNSYAIRYLSPIWQMPEIDVIQRHEYADQVRSTDRDLAARAPDDFRILSESAPPKPILLGEFGYAAAAYGDDVERTGIHFHNGIWATTFAGYAGSGMYWYWDVYIEANRLWSHYRGLQRFLDGVDLTRYQPFAPLEISGSDGGPAQAVGLGLRGDHVLVWLRSNAYTVQASIDAQQRGEADPFLYSPAPVRNLTLTLKDMDGGTYIVRWYDPQSGKWLDEVAVTAEGGALSIPVPEFRRDLAARIVPSP